MSAIMSRVDTETMITAITDQGDTRANTISRSVAGLCSTSMTKPWLIVFSVAGLFGGQAFADCLPAPDTPASVIEYFQEFNKPLPEQFCAKEESRSHASEEPFQETPEAYDETPEAPLFEWDDDGHSRPKYGWCYSEQSGKHPCDPPPLYGWCYSEQSGKHPCDPPRNRRSN